MVDEEDDGGVPVLVVVISHEVLRREGRKEGRWTGGRGRRR